MTAEIKTLTLRIERLEALLAGLTGNQGTGTISLREFRLACENGDKETQAKYWRQRGW